MARQNRSINQCAEALRKSGGFVSHAAKMLEMSQPALSKRIKKSKVLQQVVADTKEEYIDLAESKLIKAVKNGEAWAICFYLKCQARHRGWIEKVDAKVETDIDWKNIGKQFADAVSKIPTVKKEDLLG